MNYTSRSKYTPDNNATKLRHSTAKLTRQMKRAHAFATFYQLLGYIRGRRGRRHLARAMAKAEMQRVSRAG